MSDKKITPKRYTYVRTDTVAKISNKIGKYNEKYGDGAAILTTEDIPDMPNYQHITIEGQAITYAQQQSTDNSRNKLPTGEYLIVGRKFIGEPTGKTQGMKQLGQQPGTLFESYSSLDSDSFFQEMETRAHDTSCACCDVNNNKRNNIYIMVAADEQGKPKPVTKSDGTPELGTDGKPKYEYIQAGSSCVEKFGGEVPFTKLISQVNSIVDKSEQRTQVKDDKTLIDARHFLTCAMVANQYRLTDLGAPTAGTLSKKDPGAALITTDTSEQNLEQVTTKRLTDWAYALSRPNPDSTLTAITDSPKFQEAYKQQAERLQQIVETMQPYDPSTPDGRNAIHLKETLDNKFAASSAQTLTRALDELYPMTHNKIYYKPATKTDSTPHYEQRSDGKPSNRHDIAGMVEQIQCLNTTDNVVAYVTNSPVHIETTLPADLSKQKQPIQLPACDIVFTPKGELASIHQLDTQQSKKVCIYVPTEDNVHIFSQINGKQNTYSHSKESAADFAKKIETAYGNVTTETIAQFCTDEKKLPDLQKANQPIQQTQSINPNEITGTWQHNSRTGIAYISVPIEIDGQKKYAQLYENAYGKLNMTSASNTGKVTLSANNPNTQMRIYAVPPKYQAITFKTLQQCYARTLETQSKQNPAVQTPTSPKQPGTVPNGHTATPAPPAKPADTTTPRIGSNNTKTSITAYYIGENTFACSTANETNKQYTTQIRIDKKTNSNADLTVARIPQQKNAFRITGDMDTPVHVAMTPKGGTAVEQEQTMSMKQLAQNQQKYRQLSKNPAGRNTITVSQPTPAENPAVPE